MNENANAVRAEVSIRPNGRVYVGVEARRRLGLDYNDGVRVTFVNRRDNKEVTGYIDSSHHIYCGRSLHETVKHRESGTIHREALVQPTVLSWDDEAGLTDRRSDGHYTLDCK